MAGINAVIFDCFGVLTADSWREFINGLPPEVDIEAARNVHRDYDAGLITKSESSQRIQDITGRTFDELEDSNADYTKNAPLFDYIRELKQHYKIGLLSNVASSWISDYFLTAEERALFDAMVFSFEVGVTKPDPKIFNLMCQRLEVELPEAVMVDDIDRYSDAAKALGMQAVVYENLEQLKRDLAKLLKS